METKQKIKLLADLQSAIDNEELAELIKSIPSGDFIYDKVCVALGNELETLLSGKETKPPQKVGEWVSLLQALDKSMVLEILKTMHGKLGAPGIPPKPERGAAAEQGSFPPEETEPADQEELRRKWEEQQLGGGSRQPRGGLAGPF